MNTNSREVPEGTRLLLERIERSKAWTADEDRYWASASDAAHGEAIRGLVRTAGIVGSAIGGYPEPGALHYPRLDARP